MPYRSGFVSLIGRTNVGKSTLLNRLLGEKFSIVSDKPQTTRNRIQGILTRDEGQAVFLDTPGLHSARTQLGQRMNQFATSALDDIDLILFVTTADSSKVGSGDQRILSQLEQSKHPRFLVLNKCDLVTLEHRERLRDQFYSLHSWAGYYPISAQYGEGVTELSDAVFQALPEGPQFYPEEMIVDHPERFLAAEIIREKVLLLTRDEVPHGVAVVVERFSEEDVRSGDSTLIRIEATIYVDRESPKRILIGAKGAMLKQIGTLARQDIEKLLDRRVYLELWVKVRHDWRNNEASLREFGYRK